MPFHTYKYVRYKYVRCVFRCFTCKEPNNGLVSESPTIPLQASHHTMHGKRVGATGEDGVDKLSPKRAKVEMDPDVARVCAWLGGIDALPTEGTAASALPTEGTAASALPAEGTAASALSAEGAEAYELKWDNDTDGMEPRFSERASDGGMLFYPAAVEGLSEEDMHNIFAFPPGFKRVSDLPGVKQSKKEWNFKWFENDLDESLEDGDMLGDTPYAGDSMERAGDAWKQRNDKTLKDNEPLVVIAAHLGMPRAVQKILAEGAALEATCSGGLTGLMHAAAQGEEDTMCVLLDAGAKIDAVSPIGGTPIMYAAAAGRCKEVDVLIMCGANVEIRDNYGCTALLVALKAVQPHAALLLLRSGAEPNVKDCNGDTPLHIVCGRSVGIESAVLNPKP